MRTRIDMAWRLGIVALVLLPCAWWWWLSVQEEAAREEQRVAALSLSIPLGASRASVEQQCRAAVAANRGWRYVPVFASSAGTTVARVESRLRFGAGNWVVYVLFENGAVVGVLVRTLDATTQHPYHAPPDRVSDPLHPLLADFGGVQ